MWHQIELCSPSAAFIEAASLDALTTIDESVESRPQWQLGSDEPTPDDLIEADDLAAAVSRFMAGLTPRERYLVERLYWRGETQAEVARTLGVSRMAVCKASNKILARGRASLAAYRFPAAS